VRWRRWILVAVALVVINVPFLVSEWQQHRVTTEGVRVTAPVVGVTPLGDQAEITFRLPKSVDPSRTARSAKVDRAAGLRAARTHRVEVRVLKGHPAVFRLDGQVRSYASLIITVAADVLVLLMLLLSWRLGGRIRRPGLVGVAVEDVQAGVDGSLLDKQDDGTYVINGEVSEAGPSRLVLVLRDRDVTIHLRDHTNPVAVGERARVRAQLVG